MANRRRGLWILGVLALLGAFAWVVLRAHEPEFEGKPLRVILGGLEGSTWLADGYHTGVYPAPSGQYELQAERAIRTLGTNVLPLLVKMAGTRISGFTAFVGEMADVPQLSFLHLPQQKRKHEIAAWGVRQLGRAAQPAVPELVRLLGDKDPNVQCTAAQCLGGIGPGSQAQVPALIRLLSNKDPAVQCTAAQCLGGIGPGAAEAVPALVRMFKTSGRGFEWAAAYALGEIGPAASAAVPALEAVTNDFAEIALVKIGRRSFQPIFDRLKDTSNAGAWRRRANQVGSLGANAEPAIPLLVAGLQHTNDDICSSAAYALGRIHRRPDLCLKPLVVLLKRPNQNRRAGVLWALGEFGPAARPVAPEIADCLRDRSYNIRWLATNVLHRVDSDAPELKPKRL